MKVKILKHHDKNCSASKCVKMGTWDSPWFFDTYNKRDGEHLHIYADGTGRKCRTRSMGHRWVILRCNSKSCKARIMVQVDEIERHVEDLFQRATK